MEWSNHVNYLIRKVNYTIITLSQFIPYLTKELKIIFYKSFIVSNVLYCSEVWSTGLHVKDKRNLRKVIKFYSKVSSINTDELFSMLNDIYKRRFKSTVSKILNNNLHPLHICFTKFKSRRPNTRSGWLTMHTRTTKFQKSFIPQALLYLSNNTVHDLL